MQAQAAEFTARPETSAVESLCYVSMKILILNAGSSSQKSCLYEFKAEELPIPSLPLWEADIDWSHSRGVAELKVTTAQGGSLEETLKSESRSAAIGHMLRTLWSGPTKIISEPSAIDIVGHRRRLGDRRRMLETHSLPRRSERTTMSNASCPVGFIPFAPQYCASGVLLHISSLPSPYGIGYVGPAPFAAVDRLQAAGHSWWQALPLGPTGYGNSPYQCFSSFAGNGLLISQDCLIDEGLLQPGDCDAGVPPTRMNLHGGVEGNWRWSCTDEMLSTPVLDRLRGLTTSSNRRSAAVAKEVPAHRQKEGTLNG